MTLSYRLTLFTLATLTVVLAGFTAGVLLMADAYLRRNVDSQLATSLDAMAASVDIKSSGLTWNPPRRHLHLSALPGGAVVRWLVHGDEGDLVSRSQEDETEPLLRAVSGSEEAGPPYILADEEGHRWRVQHRRVMAPRQYFRDSSTPPARGSDRKRGQLLLTAGCRMDEVHGQVAHLAWLLLGLCSGVLAVASLACRWVSRGALSPVAAMAEAAGALGPSDLSARLPEPSARDELADLARSFNGLMDRVQEAYERQRLFAAEASHQLRSPLAGILAQAEVALRRDRDGEGYRAALTAIRERASQLTRVIEMLLLLARGEAEGSQLGRAPIDLIEWLSQYSRAWEGHPRQADLCCEAPAGEAWAMTHQILLSQVVDTLVDNAFKHGAPGTEVTVSLMVMGGEARLAVVDQGPGIEQDELPRLFSPFYRTRRSREEGKPGLGLGLSVARRLAGLLGARLEVFSELGNGARFCLALPLLDTSTAC